VVVLKLEGLQVLIVADVSAEKLHGGAERMLHHHIRALNEAGAKVGVLTKKPNPKVKSLHKLPNGVMEHRLHFNGDKGWKGLKQLRREAAAWWELHKGYDVVVAEQPIVMSALLRAGCDLPRLEVCHSFAFEEYATRHGLHWNWQHRLASMALKRLEKRVYKDAQGYLVLSRFMQQRLHDFFEIEQDKITVSAGGIETLPLKWEERKALRSQLWGEWLADHPHAPIIVTLRNLVPRTGVDLLIQAAAIVHVDRPDARWMVMGNGDLLEPLKGLRKELAMDEVVEFAGFVAEKEVNQRLWTADLFMLPTRALEGFGLVTLEANAHGLPVIATPAAANPDVVGWHDSNRVAEAISPEALAEEVLHYLDVLPRAAERELLSEETLEHFSWSKHDEDFLNAVKELY